MRYVLACLAMLLLVGCAKTAQPVVSSTRVAVVVGATPTAATTPQPLSDDAVAVTAAKAALDQDAATMGRVFPSMVNPAAYLKSVDNLSQVDQYKLAGEPKVTTGPTEDQGAVLYRVEAPVTSVTGKPYTYYFRIWTDPVRHVVTHIIYDGVDHAF